LEAQFDLFFPIELEVRFLNAMPDASQISSGTAML
jgi:hypothetical protein